MKISLLSILLVVLLFACKNTVEQVPVLRQDQYYTHEEGAAELAEMESMYSNKAEWEERKQLLREQILKGMNLSPLPERTPLNTVIKSKRIKDGYSVENVYFESIPGYYVCGNLYRPLDDSQKYPGILCPHGHFEGDTLGAFGQQSWLAFIAGF